jgi:hypothetical protein
MTSAAGMNLRSWLCRYWLEIVLVSIPEGYFVGSSAVSDYAHNAPFRVLHSDNAFAYVYIAYYYYKFIQLLEF